MEKVIHVQDGFVWAEDTGEDLPPLVFLHPGIGDSRIWDKVWESLRGQYRLIRYDARGYGRSAAPTMPFSLLQDLIWVLNELSIPEATLVGCSMGAATAIDFALAHPDRVRAMVLAAPGISGFPRPSEPELEAEMDALESARDLNGLAAVGLRVWARTAPADPTAVDLMRTAAKAWLAWDGYFQPDAPAWDRLTEIAVPSVLLVGDLDKPSLVESNVEAARRIPGCRFVSLPGIDHFLPLHAPSAVIDAIHSLV